MSRSDGIDELDPRFPIRHDPPAAFWQMARQRPDRPALAGLAERARADEASPVETFVRPLPAEDPPAVSFAVPYPPLAEDTLAAGFEPLEPLPEMTP